jgi:hypothetical protein
MESLIYEVRLLRNVLTASEVHSASYPNATEVLFEGGELRGRVVKFTTDLQLVPR